MKDFAAPTIYYCRERRRQHNPASNQTAVDAMSHNTMPATVPAYTSISGWCGLSGMSRSATYNFLAAPDGLIARKVGGRTLIDVQHGLAWLASRPVARFRPAKGAG